MKNQHPIFRFLFILFIMCIGIISMNKACQDTEQQNYQTNTKDKSFETDNKPIYKLSDEEEIAKDPKSYLKLIPKSWSIEGFGVIAIQNFDIENTSKIDMKDVSIKFTYFSESKTELSTSTQIVYKTVKAKSKIKVRNFNAGFINQQTTNCQLEIVDAVPIIVYK